MIHPRSIACLISAIISVRLEGILPAPNVCRMQPCVGGCRKARTLTNHFIIKLSTLPLPLFVLILSNWENGCNIVVLQVKEQVPFFKNVC